MRTFNIILVVLSFVLLAAHFLRLGWYVLVVALIVAPFLLFYRKKWVGIALQMLLFLSAIEWIRTIFETINYRITTGQDWARMLIIMLIVVLVTLYSAVSFRLKPMKNYFDQ